MPRLGLQYHWHNDNYASFEEYLATLKQSRRKAIRQERRKVREAGLTIRRLRGEQISSSDWSSFYQLYMATVQRKWGHEYLKRGFFEEMGASMGERVLLLLAEDARGEVGGRSALLAGPHPSPSPLTLTPTPNHHPSPSPSPITDHRSPSSSPITHHPHPHPASYPIPHLSPFTPHTSPSPSPSPSPSSSPSPSPSPLPSPSPSPITDHPHPHLHPHPHPHPGRGRSAQLDWLRLHLRSHVGMRAPHRLAPL